MYNLIFLAIGLGTGVLAGIFGIGGGIIIVPALILLAKFPPQNATGTSLAVFLLPVGLLGAYHYYKEGYVRVLPALLIALGVFIGGYFGARVSTQMSPLVLKRSFAVLLVAVAARMWFGK
jgi:uncharacterized membrane protein YfcA